MIVALSFFVVYIVALHMTDCYYRWRS